MGSRLVIAAAVVTTVAFVAYSRTLLPGVDLGDTGAFQAAVLWPEISARQAYPLYYALAKPFVQVLSPDNPARALNLFSAACGALAAGLLTGVVAGVTTSVGGGVVAGLLLAFSYTFWTQAVIAEVYTLHLLIVGCCLTALMAWWRRPSVWRLTLFFVAYAAGFGNHLSMILLLVPFAAFLLLAADRPPAMAQPRIILLAIGIAAAGALQYAPSLFAVWGAIDAPEKWTDRLAAFWFDVTKSDWRESMVLGVRASDYSKRLAMFAFDARQQFGIAGLALAAAGAIALFRISRSWALLVLLAYAINTAFAVTYNVGDPHVFFLPSHYFAAFAAGAAVAEAARLFDARRGAAIAVVAAGLGYAAWRGYDTWPAADRHTDRRAEVLVTRLTAGLDDRNALLTARLNWQVENALLYESRYHLPHLTWVRLDDVLLHFPLLVRDNHATGRDVVVTADAVPPLAGAFGSLLPIVPDPVPALPTLAGYASRIPRGALYVLAVLAPSRDELLDAGDLRDAVSALTGGRVAPAGDAAYEVLLGRAGEPPILHRRESQPFRDRLSLPEGALDIRMDGFVPLETFRRAGFGRVALNRRPMLTIERGVSLTALEAREPIYAAGVYEPQARFRIPAGLPQMALLH